MNKSNYKIKKYGIKNLKISLKIPQKLSKMNWDTIN